MKTTIPMLTGLLLLLQSLFAGSTIQFQTKGFTVAETAGQVPLSVVRVNDLETEVAVEFFTIEGNATAEQDFAAVSGTLSFAAGVTKQTIYVPVLNDALFEGLERFRVALTNATGGAVLGSMKVATVSIQDNDTPVEFTTTDYFVGEADGVIEVPVFRGDDGDLPVTIDYATADGTALAGVDYEAINGALTFETGRTTKFVTVPILNETLMEGNKTFSVQLSNLQGASVLGSRTNATVSIVDNETLVQLEFTTYWAREDEESVLIGIVRGGDWSEPVALEYATADGTALAGEDYTATSGTLTFEVGENLKLLTIPILNDGIKESNEQFRFSLTNAPAGTLGAAKIATISIQDNDAGVQFQPYNLYRVAENEGARTLTVVRGSDGNLGPLTVDYATSNLTATAGLDYVATSGTLSFAEGEMVKTLTVPIVYDEVTEVDEQFNVTLSHPTGGDVLGPYAAATIVILDITHTPPHRLDGIAVQPDQSVQLTLGGSADRHFRDYFDLYPVEVSSNLVDWTPLVTLVRTNAETKALSFTDTQASNLDQRFYRTATNHLITPWVKPTGPFTPGVVSRLLTDPTRRNRYWLSTNCAFMISVWYPAVAQGGRLPNPSIGLQIAQDPTWMAAYGMGDFTARMPYLRSHALADAPCASQQAPYPILLSSPGWTGQGAISVAEIGPNLASHGYVVVSVDHYDAMRTVFPDGTYLQGDISGISTAGLQDRVKDLVFILDELTRWNTSDSVFAGRLDLTKVAAIGGSWGGVTASEFARVDDRCKALIGLDGTIDAIAPRLQQPALQINASGNGDSKLYDTTTNHAVFFQISSTDHLMIAAVDWYWAWRPTDVAGGREVARTVNAYSLWFLNKHLKGSTDPMPALAEYPRVVNFQEK